MSTFGQRLTELIKESGKSQKEVAEAIEVSQAAISFYVCDQSYPKFDTVVRIAKCFGVTTDYLFGLTDQRGPEKSIDELKRERDLLNYEIVRKRKAISMINGILERI